MRRAAGRGVGVAVVVSLALAGVARGGPPRDWFGGGEGYERALDEAVKHGGKASGALKSTGEVENAFGTMMQAVNADQYKGKRLRMSAYVKSDGVEGWSGLWMRVDGADKTGLAFDNMMERPIKGKTDWTKYEIVLDVPDDAVEIDFGILLAGKGTVWIDDLTFETVGKDVPTTGQPTATMDRQGERAQNLPGEPKNPDFEP